MGKLSMTTFAVVVASLSSAIGCASPTESPESPTDVPGTGIIAQRPPADVATKIDAPLDSSLALTSAGSDDVTSPADGTIGGDQKLDAVFEVRLEKPVRALTLLTVDADGNAVGGQQWDTIVDKDPIAVRADSRFVEGGWTWQLAVTTSDGTLLNDASGRLGGEGRQTLGTVKLHASNSGFFNAGQRLRLVATLADGSVVAGPTFAYDGPNLGPSVLSAGGG